MSTIGIGSFSNGNAFATTVTTANVNTNTGSTFIVATNPQPSSSLTIVDSYSNSWGNVISIPYNSPFSATNLWICQNGIGGSNHSVTITLTSATPLAVCFIEIINAANSSLDQQTSLTNQDNSTLNGPNVTTTQSNELILSIFGLLGSSTNIITGANNGFSIGETYYEPNIPSFISWAYKIVSSVGTYATELIATGSPTLNYSAGTISLVQGSSIVIVPTFKFYANGAYQASSFVEGNSGLPINTILRMYANGEAQINSMSEGPTQHLFANGIFQATQFIE